MNQNTMRLSVLMLSLVVSIQTNILGMNFLGKRGSQEDAKRIWRDYFKNQTPNLISKNNEDTVYIYLKNESVGLVGNYDIYAQIVPSMQASRIGYEEVFIPYNETKLIGKLSSMSDIKTRGDKALSLWAYNKVMLDNYRKQISTWTSAEYHLTLTVNAGNLGFYIEPVNT